MGAETTPGQFVVTWLAPDGVPHQSTPRAYLHAYRLAANLLSARVEEVPGDVGEVLHRVSTRKTKIESVVTNVVVQKWAP
jgi:hypothetical protein